MVVLADCDKEEMDSELDIKALAARGIEVGLPGTADVLASCS